MRMEKEGGAPMLQKHSSPLFCKPTTYFGSYQNLEEEIFGEEVDFADPWSLALEKELVFSLRQNIGIFIHWSDF
jgi:hypothetical protein